MSTIYFTYHIYHPETNKHYYGARWKEGCSPKDLWKTYFTSSKKVHNLIEEYGKDSFIVEIRKTFDSKEKCLSWEQRVLKRLKVKKNDNWLNIAIGKPTMLGKKHSVSTKEKMKKPKGSWSEERKKAKSEEMKRKISSGDHKMPTTSGHTWSTETREKMKNRVPWNKDKSGLQTAWNKGLKKTNSNEAKITKSNSRSD
jgi:hypothetical protein